MCSLKDLKVVGFESKFEFSIKGFVDGLGVSIRDNKVKE